MIFIVVGTCNFHDSQTFSFPPICGSGLLKAEERIEDWTETGPQACQSQKRAAVTWYDDGAYFPNWFLCELGCGTDCPSRDVRTDRKSDNARTGRMRFVRFDV